MKIDELKDELQKKYHGRVRTLDIEKSGLSGNYIISWRPWKFYSVSLITGNKTYSSKDKHIIVIDLEMLDEPDKGVIDMITKHYIDPTVELSKGYFAGVNTDLVKVPKGWIK